MIASVNSQTATTKERDLCWLLSYRTGKAASHSVRMRKESGENDYDRKVELIRRAFKEISRLVFKHDYTVTAEDWRALDEARLDDPTLSYDEVRARLVEVYRRIKRACEKGVSHAQREA
ncbi:MAG: hypothetical protein QXT73_05750 [Candidatus Methanomethylicaceae archaeon]